ncbi:hypothetical protein Tco_0990164 [Tanacetum coccineum]|uniref:MAK10-like protein n=1 Tax=Tanacetum coccineum TaxID=301880 RepID=A0ABQ5EWT5_9ASTR
MITILKSCLYYTATIRDENPIRTLRDYSKPSHEGYRNTIELPEGNNVVPLRSDTIRLVQNECSFHRLWSEDPNQHLKDFLKLCEIDCAAGGKLRHKNSNESWEIIENLALYDHEGLNDSKDHVKPIKAVAISLSAPKMPDRRLLELEDQINFLLKGPQPTPKASSTHTPQAYAKLDSSDPLLRGLNELPRQSYFTFRERVGPNPQPQALETSFEAQVQDYMAAHTERMERFENAIFKQREVFNDRMAEIFGLLMELAASRTSEKILISDGSN